MKSKTVSTIAVVAIVIFIVATLFAAIVPNLSAVSILSSGIIVVFVLFCAAKILKNQETIIEQLKILTGEEMPAPPKTNEPIPVPTFNQGKRHAAIQKVKKAGFEATERCTVNNYSVAVDSNRREWVVVPPHGKDVEVRPFSAYGGYEVIRDTGNAVKDSDVLSLRIRVENAPPCFIVIAKGAAVESGDHADEIRKVTDVLDTIK